MTRIVLDTNAYTRYLAGDRVVFEALASADTVFMSIFVLGELYAGFRGRRRESENKTTLNEFLSKPTVKILNATAETAEIFGVVKNNLKVAGTPIPVGDVWIASHALESGSKVVTFDRHFKTVPGLLIWDVEQL